ncbi:MAG: HXXEE domain-containing protein [Candidatus Pelethousia sp.]|nr:HXXEE domain-containing protein [Candidatus Pelethousia sp.]
MVKTLDKWCDNIWIWVMCMIGAATAVYLLLNWGELPLGAKAGAFGAIIMPLHVIEEWKLPGGLHYIYNVIFGSKKMGSKYLDRYPMSRLTDMITNFGLVLFPLLFLVLSNVAGLSSEMAICIMLFSFGEVFAHTVVGIYSFLRYRKAGKRSIYCPGFGTAYLLFLPAGIYLVSAMPVLTVQNWTGGLIAMAVMCVFCVPIPEIPLKKWVLKQDDDAFAFKSPKHYAKFVNREHFEEGQVW